MIIDILFAHLNVSHDGSSLPFSDINDIVIKIESFQTQTHAQRRLLIDLFLI